MVGIITWASNNSFQKALLQISSLATYSGWLFNWLQFYSGCRLIGSSCTTEAAPAQNSPVFSLIGMQSFRMGQNRRRKIARHDPFLFRVSGKGTSWLGNARQVR